MADLIANLLQVSSSVRSSLLLAAPKVVQAHFAAASDYFTWKLAVKVYGRSSSASYGAVSEFVCSFDHSVRI